MARFRIYLKTFDTEGEYQSDFIEITRDVVKIGAITQILDNTEYDIGIYRNSNCKITVRNDHGKYLEPDGLRSIFPFKRTGSIVKITWDIRDYDLCVGFFKAGEELLGHEITIFEGLLDEVPASSSIVDQSVEFTILGFESLFDKVLVPFGDIVDLGDDFMNPDTMSDVIYKCLNQPFITNILIVDSDNINPALDPRVDEKDSLEDKTVRAALSEILLACNSVLYIKDRAIYVTSRAASNDIKYQFYGQASVNGLENIIDIKNYRDGLNRTFNYWAWRETSFFSQEISSVEKFGILRKELSLDLVTAISPDNIQAILDENRTEFGVPKPEFDLETPISYESLDLFHLDRVSIDYPTIFVPADNNPLPRYGQNIYGAARYPYGQWSLTLDPLDNFKIQSRKIDPAKQTITFGMRKI